MLKFSKANNKIASLASVKAIKPFLGLKRKIYSLDLISGWSCPYADECLSKVIVDKIGKRTIKDGPNTKFRCFSASQEALFTYVYKNRKHNFDYIREQIKNGINYIDLAILIESQMPKNLGVLRIHVGGDFFHQVYFDAMVLLAKRNPDKLFYAYTKSLKFWVNRLDNGFTDNFVLTASRGGRLDYLIDENNLRSVTVVADPIVTAKIAKLKHHNKIPKLGMAYDGFPIDHDDSHAADPSKRNEDFALLIHGSQPASSPASKALVFLKGIGSYGKKKVTK